VIGEALPVALVERRRAANPGEAADGSGAERGSAESGSGPAKRTEPGAAGGPGRDELAMRWRRKPDLRAQIAAIILPPLLRL
jgi:hypothetical protein